ncbi:transcriptional regulator, ModE family protein [Halorubrum californiense DSM 19288]|uniref:Transcriptional regulator, ModE family protein n=1 Tax=Halorubrum californiense DSM 19288 TaxID=1227465 RepID=M0EFZ6_9EURY|nr:MULTISPECIES: TOBE domain-containing protein [Halorubrum]ELZ45812.1 transcriptional regulator, ModE family protein [Halorubrum californiense DSM 19288]TKX69066.1 LysR family transcriptional regulator [Halorubrum sp. GN11GM_10-3_MGM]
MRDSTGSGADPAAGRGRAALIEGGVEFDGRDAALLRAVDAAGSVAGAAEALGRSRARALTRIETLEEAYGTLVERRRGGEGGGGSRLAPSARDLLDRYDRLQAVLAATASVPETVLRGTVEAIDGEIAVVDTPVGELSGLHGGAGGEGNDGGDGGDGAAVAVGDAVQVRIGADAVTVNDAANAVDPDATSARNRLDGRVSEIDSGETVSTVRIEVEPADGKETSDVGAVDVAALITAESVDRLGLAPGDPVSIRWKATATRLVAQTGRR